MLETFWIYPINDTKYQKRRRKPTYLIQDLNRLVHKYPRPSYHQENQIHLKSLNRHPIWIMNNDFDLRNLDLINHIQKTYDYNSFFAIPDRFHHPIQKQYLMQLSLYQQRKDFCEPNPMVLEAWDQSGQTKSRYRKNHYFKLESLSFNLLSSWES